MKTLEYRTVDKSAWGDGPWQHEPDKVQWRDAATGLPCLIVRNLMGALCGYVGVPPGHPAHGKPFGDLNLDVHGGLTFADHCQPGPENEAICHIPEPGEPDTVYWLGFDAGHAFDFSPAMAADMKLCASDLLHHWIFADEVYRDLAYMQAEVAGLAAQLAAGPTDAPP